MSTVYQINVKPDTPGEAGLPKVSVPTTQVNSGQDQFHLYFIIS